MTWLEHDFAKVCDFGAIVPEHTWGIDEISAPSIKRRKPNHHLGWRELLIAGTGNLLGQVVRVDQSLGNNVLLYLKDEIDLGTCLVPKKKTPKLGDLLEVRVIELRTIESVPQVNQMICTIHKVAFSCDSTVKSLGSAFKILNFPWEIEGPNYSGLEEIVLDNKSHKFRRLRLMIADISKNDNDKDEHHPQVTCRDTQGSMVRVNISLGRVNIDMLNVGNALILSDPTVTKHGEIYSVYIKQQSIFEIEPAEHHQIVDVPEFSQERISNVSIEEAILQVSNIPEGCEDSIDVYGFITFIGIGMMKIISVTCFACQKRFNVDQSWDRTCPSCGEHRERLADWRPRFGCSISISDASGTWKGLYLNGPIAADLFDILPETFLQLDRLQIDTLRRKWLFAPVTISLQCRPFSAKIIAVNLLHCVGIHPTFPLRCDVHSKSPLLPQPIPPSEGLIDQRLIDILFLSMAVVPKYRSSRDRRDGWLCGCENLTITHHNSLISEQMEEQITLDIARAFTQFTSTDYYQYYLRILVLMARSAYRSRNNCLRCYYDCLPSIQTFTTFNVLVMSLPLDDAYMVATKLSRTHFRDFMREDLDIIHPLVGMMLAIVKASDHVVYERLSILSIPPFFCVSWMLTWFSHDLLYLYDSQRIFDFLIANHPIAIVYASAVIPILFREELLQMLAQPETHQWLKELPKRVQPSLLILHTVRLMRDHPPASLQFEGMEIIQKTVFGGKGGRVRRDWSLSLPKWMIGIAVMILLLAILVDAFING